MRALFFLGIVLQAGAVWAEPATEISCPAQFLTFLSSEGENSSETVLFLSGSEDEGILVRVVEVYQELLDRAAGIISDEDLDWMLQKDQFFDLPRVKTSEAVALRSALVRLGIFVIENVLDQSLLRTQIRDLVVKWRDDLDTQKSASQQGKANVPKDPGISFLPTRELISPETLSGLYLSPEGNSMIGVVDHDHIVIRFDLSQFTITKGRFPSRFTGDTSGGYSSDGKFFFVGAYRRDIIAIMNAETLDFEGPFAVPETAQSPNAEVIVNSNGARIATGNSEGFAVWDVSGKEIVGSSPLLQIGRVNGFTPSGEYLFRVGDAKRVELSGILSPSFDLDYSEFFPETVARNQRYAFSPVDERIAVIDSFSPQVFVWYWKKTVSRQAALNKDHHSYSSRDYPDDILKLEVPELIVDRGYYAVTFSPDGALVAAASNDGMIVVWNAHLGGIVAAWRASDQDPIHQLLFTLDGRTLISSSIQQRRIRFWDIKR